MAGRSPTVYPLFRRLCTLFDGRGSMPMQHQNARHRSYLHTPRHRFHLTLLPLAALYLSTALTAYSEAQLNPNLMKYACGPANRMFATLSPASRFTDSTAGFDLVASPTVNGKACTSDKPFFFSVPIPEGNYRITVVLGGPQASVTTVRAEGRRLMLEKIATQPGASVTLSFDTNVRYPEIQGQPSGNPTTPASAPSTSNPSESRQTSPSSTSPATPPSSTSTTSPGPPGARCSPASSSPASSSPTTPNPARPQRASSANIASPK